MPAPPSAPAARQRPFSDEERTDHELLRRHRQGDPHAREHLVQRLMPMVQRMARVYPAHEHADDMQQAAAFGLAKALERFDPERGVPLRGYVVPTVLGEVRRYRRDHCWAVRPPRTLQERILKVTRHTDDLTVELGRSPSPREVSGALGEPEEDVVEALVAGRAYLADSLDAPAFADDGDGGATLGDGLSHVEDGYARTEHAELIDSLRDELSPEEWALLHLRFVADWTQEEIGRLLGVSQMTISRRQRSALGRLRLRISSDGELVAALGLQDSPPTVPVAA